MASPPRQRGWIWFFVLLGVMGGFAVAVPLIYNLKQQLRPEELRVARELWKEKAPSDYDVEYEIRRQSDGDNPDDPPERETYRIEVREGKPVSIQRDHKALPLDAYESHSIDAILDMIAANLEVDSPSEGRRNYAHAQFDKTDGHPIHYVRLIMGTRQRIEFIIQLTRVTAGHAAQ